MGNHVSHPVATSLDVIVTDVPDFTLSKRLGSARFLKTLRGRGPSGQPTVLKVFVKPEPDFDVSVEIRRAQAESRAIAGISGLCGYTSVFETDKAVFLMRPFFHSNLYDRISTRPFLHVLERKWIAFQLISALHQCHARKVRHGDIKSENVMVTSWNSVHLTDFASFKPPTLPVDNPSEFVYFFDARSRRTCYLAPERFQEDEVLELTDAMDIFSLGCVIAELFLEGRVLFNLSQLLKYRRGEHSPLPDLEAIEDEGIRLSAHISDVQRLDRVVPYLLWVVQNVAAPSVQSLALRTLTQILASIKSIASEDMGLFTELLFPLFSRLVCHPEPVLRATFAYCLADLADACVQFLDLGNVIAEREQVHRDGGYLMLQTPDIILAEIQRTFLDYLQTLLSDENVFVRRAVLSKVSRFCVFFGRQIANDVILSHIITYLNDKDPLLRSALFESMAGVSAVAGERSLQEYILPLLLPSLHQDPSPMVVERVLDALSAIANLKQLNKIQLRDIVRQCAPFLIHPSAFLRSAAVSTVCECASALNDLDVMCLLMPSLTPYFVSPAPPFVVGLTPLHLMHMLISPIKHSTMYQLKAPADQQSKAGGLRHRGSMPSGESAKLALIRPILRQAAAASEDALATSDSNLPPFQNGRRISMQSLRIAPHTVFLTPDLANSGPSTRRNGTSAAHGQRRAQSMILDASYVVPGAHAAFSGVEHRSNSMGMAEWDAVNRFGPGHHRASDPTALRQRTGSNASIHSTSSQGGGSSLPLKARAETSTVNATITASLSRGTSPFSPRRGVNGGGGGGPSGLAAGLTLRNEWANQHEGKNWYVRELLATKAREGTSPYLAAAGSAVPPPAPVPAPAAGADLASWRPKGALLALFTEHTGAVNHVAVSGDSSIIVSVSSDGCMKVWDVSRVCRNLGVKSRITHRVGGVVRAAVFLADAPHVVAAASETGAVHVVALNVRARSARTLHKHALPPGEGAVALAHYRTDGESVLLVASTASALYGFRAGTSEVAFTLACPPAYGMISSLLVDPRPTGPAAWALVGTMRGILVLFDLRFRTAVAAWTHPARSRVHALTAHAGDPDSVLVACGRGEVSVWHLSTQRCTHLFTRYPAPAIVAAVTVAAGGDAAAAAAAATASAGSPQRTRHGGMARATTPPSPATASGGGSGGWSYQALVSPKASDFVLNSTRVFEETQATEGVFAIAAGPGSSTGRGGSSSGGQRVFMAGSDRRVRWWDPQSGTGAQVIGRDEAGGEGSGLAAVYAAADCDVVRVTVESVGPVSAAAQGDAGPGATAAAAGAGRGGARARTGSGTAPAAAPPSSTGSGSSSSVGFTLGEGRAAATEHRDAITGVAVVSHPQPLLVTCSRDGTIRLWK
ncbi:Serine/threonine-protein kinase [Blastocladiella emersonii ATCC 22665]|nr:Serine/threonine-protein kinase [Blastocladiella emersonii ATCC 22665]